MTKKGNVALVEFYNIDIGFPSKYVLTLWTFFFFTKATFFKAMSGLSPYRTSWKTPRRRKTASAISSLLFQAITWIQTCDLLACLSDDTPLLTLYTVE